MVENLENKIEFEEENKKQYSFEEVFQDSLKYFNGNEMITKIWVNKYALKDSQDNLYEKNPEQMHERLTKEFYRIESKYKNPLSKEEIFSLFKNFKYLIPGGSILSGIGNNRQIVSVSNCFVIGNDSDSYGGIMKIDQEQVQLMKRRGGVGHDLSHIRPKGSPVKNSALTSTGIVPFMERYSNSTREVAQDGRRGALMLSISIKHPDSEAFIDAKLKEGKITGANISVKLDDEFMKAVIRDEDYIQQFPINSNKPSVKKRIKAKTLWDKIIYNAWKSAEPGVLFWDTIKKESIPDVYSKEGFKTISTNPCGEVPLCPYDSCRLMAMNLYSYVNKPFTPNASFDSNLFKKHVRQAQRIMDDVVDIEIEKIGDILTKINKDPEDEKIKATEDDLWKKIREKAILGRRTGLGITGEGDMLAALGMRYGSQNAIKFATELHKEMALEAYRSSVELAKERGAFKIYNSEKEKNNPFIKRIEKNDKQLYSEMVKYGRRNISLLALAPTGTISQMTQTSSGIEPAFLISYKRRKKVNPNDKHIKISYNVFHPKFRTWLKINGYDYEKVKNYDNEELEEIIKKSPYYKSTSKDINWIDKVKMQGAIQKWVDHSISVTVNIPEETNEETVDKIYKEAWKAECKGVTIYREGSRDGVLISNKKRKDIGGLEKIFPNERPKILKADVHRFMNANGKNEQWLAVVGKIKDKPYEIFLGKSEGFSIPEWAKTGEVIKEKLKNKKSRYDFRFKNKDGYNIVMEGLSRSFDKEFWNYAKLISAILRNETPILDTTKILKGLNLGPEDNINTWKKGVVRVLSRYIPDGTKEKGEEPCPQCRDEKPIWKYENGCKTCSNCGFSRCG